MSRDIKLNPLKISATSIGFGLAITIKQTEPGIKSEITFTDNMVDSLCAILLQIKTKGCRSSDVFLVEDIE